MGTFIADIRHAIRLLVKSPGFAAVAVAALALGIGANTAIFSVVNAVLLQPLPYPDSNRIMFVMRSYKNGTSSSSSIPKFMAWHQNSVFEALAAYNFSGPGVNLGGGERPEQLHGNHVSLDYFRVFGARPVLGRTFLPEEDRPGGARVVVLSESLWQRRFGRDPNIIGRTINLNNDLYSVVGVISRSFQPDPPIDVFVPLQPDPNSTNQGNYLAVAGQIGRAHV